MSRLTVLALALALLGCKTTGMVRRAYTYAGGALVIDADPTAVASATELELSARELQIEERYPQDAIAFVIAKTPSRFGNAGEYVRIGIEPYGAGKSRCLLYTTPVRPASGDEQPDLGNLCSNVAARLHANTSASSGR